MASLFCSTGNELYSTQAEIDFGKNLQEESDFDFIELAQYLQEKRPSLDKIHQFYTRQAKKWSKRLLDCKKTIYENHAFYQEGRSIWMKDLATLSRTLQNVKSDCQANIKELLGYIASLESKYYEILNEIAPFTNANPRNNKTARSNKDEALSSSLKEFSSSILLLKINEELRKKVFEIENFRLRIESLKSGQWVREEDATKTIERVSKYTNSWMSSTPDSTLTDETSEELNPQFKPIDLILNNNKHSEGDDFFNGSLQIPHENVANAFLHKSKKLPNFKSIEDIKQNIPLTGNPKKSYRPTRLDEIDCVETMIKNPKKAHYTSFIGVNEIKMEQTSFLNSERGWPQTDLYTNLIKPNMQCVDMKGGDNERSIHLTSSFGSVSVGTRNLDTMEMNHESETNILGHKNKIPRIRPPQIHGQDQQCMIVQDTPRIVDIDLRTSNQNLKVLDEFRINSTPKSSSQKSFKKLKCSFQKMIS